MRRTREDQAVETDGRIGRGRHRGRRIGLAAVLSAAAAVTTMAVPAGAHSAASRSIPVVLEGYESFVTGTSTFTAAGGVVCPSGTSPGTSDISLHGDVLTFDVAKTFTCDDGSGTFDIHIRANFQFCDPTDEGVWKVTGGTGAYAHLKGGGQLVGVYFPGDGCSAEGILDHYVGTMKA